MKENKKESFIYDDLCFQGNKMGLYLLLKTEKKWTIIVRNKVKYLFIARKKLNENRRKGEAKIVA